MSLTASTEQIAAASALEQAAALRRRQLSSVELVRSVLDRIAAADGELHAFVAVWAERALRQARAKDRALARGGPLPPFCGVPIAIKDLNFVRGGWTRMGSRGFRFWSPLDDRATAQLRRGGFVIVGKLATSELGAMPVTEPDIHPPTRNPWQLGHSAGGSSGGSAAAVAAGLLPVAHGSDGAGSIRIPSSFCHLVGLKPSRGRLANAFGLNDRELLYTDGALTRTVADAAALLDLQAGVSVGRRHWAPLPPRPFSVLYREPPPPLLVRLVIRSSFGAVDPEVEQAVRGVAQTLVELGHRVEEQPPLHAELAEFLPLWQHQVAQVPFVRWSKVQPVTAWLAGAGRRVRRTQVIALRRRLSARLFGWFGDADLLLTPTTPTPAPPLGAFASLPPAEAFAAAAPLGAFTALANITGQPAISIPAGLSAAGLPLGAQLIGRTFAEAQLLAVAGQLEVAMPWAGRHPQALAGARA